MKYIYIRNFDKLFLIFFQKNNEIEKFKLQGIELEDQRKKILKELEEQQLVCSQEADDYSKKNKEISKILDQLRAGTHKVTDLNESEVLFAFSLPLES